MTDKDLIAAVLKRVDLEGPTKVAAAAGLTERTIYRLRHTKAIGRRATRQALKAALGVA